MAQKPKALSMVHLTTRVCVVVRVWYKGQVSTMVVAFEKQLSIVLSGGTAL